MTSGDISTGNRMRMQIPYNLGTEVRAKNNIWEAQSGHREDIAELER